MAYILVIDIGKTHVKLHLLDQQLRQIEQFNTVNSSLPGPPYPHFDTDAIWHWITSIIVSLPQRRHIRAISITTHGATAALVNRHVEGNALTLPILDYEFAEVASCNTLYAEHRSDYAQTLSPDLPLGLNLGRQLFWLQTNFPQQFAQTTDILLYPQYWSWRFCGNPATEVTSLGCHTDLWLPYAKAYSGLVKQCDWEKLLPPIVPAWHCIGTVTESVSTSTGLSPHCQVFVGVHDSNASYLRYLSQTTFKSFAVVSTGTWTIVMSSNTPLPALNAKRDMLANVDINRRPVACSRFMGGREFEIICEKLAAKVTDKFSMEDLQKIINAQVMALPNFSNGSGPFPESKPAFIGNTVQHSGAAIATLYCALMIDYQLELLQVSGDIFIEGSFVRNSLLCSVIAQLRDKQKVHLSADTTGTALGCAMLTQWKRRKDYGLNLTPCQPIQLKNILSYRDHWRAQLTANSSL